MANQYNHSFSVIDRSRSLSPQSLTRQRIKRRLIKFDNRLFWPSEVVVLKRRSINSTLHRPLLCCIEVPTLVLYVEVWMWSVMVGDPVICNESHVGVTHKFLAQ